MDKLTLINKALLKVGLPLAAAEDDCDWNAAMVFEDVAEKAIRGHNWGFAQKFAVLAQGGQAPAFGFKYAYGMPADCLKVIDVRRNQDLRAPKARFVASGRMIYSNVAPCNARYLYKAMDPELWPADFADAVAGRIACEIAALSAERAALVPQLTQLAELAMNQAMMADARESAERISLDGSIYAGRGRGE